MPKDGLRTGVASQHRVSTQAAADKTKDSERRGNTRTLIPLRGIVKCLSHLVGEHRMSGTDECHARDETTR